MGGYHDTKKFLGNEAVTEPYTVVYGETLYLPEVTTYRKHITEVYTSACHTKDKELRRSLPETAGGSLGESEGHRNKDKDVNSFIFFLPKRERSS